MDSDHDADQPWPMPKEALEQRFPLREDTTVGRNGQAIVSPLCSVTDWGCPAKAWPKGTEAGGWNLIALLADKVSLLWKGDLNGTPPWLATLPNRLMKLLLVKIKKKKHLKQCRELSATIKVFGIPCIITYNFKT